jgi:hypothetical protein
MIAAAAIFLLLFMAVTLEVAGGGFGLVLPLTASAVFYLGGMLGWRAALPLAVLAGAWLDLLFGRPWLASSVAMVAVCLGSQAWPTGERGQPLGIYLLPGAFLGGVTALVPSLAEWLATGGEPSLALVLGMAGQAVAATVFGALLLPSLILAVDLAAGIFRLPQFRPDVELSPRRELGGDLSRGPAPRGGR